MTESMWKPLYDLLVQRLRTLSQIEKEKFISDMEKVIVRLKEKEKSNVKT